MLPYAIYLLKVIICSGILLGYYWLMLRDKIFHSYNRFYLLATIILSLILPLIQINIWPAVTTSSPQAIEILQVINGSGEYLSNITANNVHNNFTLQQFLILLYACTSTVFFCLFINVLIRIYSMLKRNSCKLFGDIYFINTSDKGTPFSFLKYIFWNENIDINTTTGNQIFKHEVVHIREKHSYDKLFVNAVLIFFWCNPCFWLIRKELNMIHEFIADKKAVEGDDTEAFAAMILQAAYPQHRFQLVNNFFYSPIKRRLMMLAKNNNSTASYIGRILVLPLAILVFAAFTLKANAVNEDQQEDVIIAKSILPSVNSYMFVKTVPLPVTTIDDPDEHSSFLNVDTAGNKATFSIYNSLIIIDGKETDSMALKALDPNSIESMNVYKGKTALIKYGDKGRNGVVIVELKKKHFPVKQTIQKPNQVQNPVTTMIHQRVTA